MSENGKYYGKYRAIVTDVNDPIHSGRIRVRCPRVLGNAVSSWCLPCIPNAIDGSGDFFLPPVGEAVWVEFEEGDISKPIWSGGWYSTSSASSLSAGSYSGARVISYGGVTIILNKSEGVLYLCSQGVTTALTPENLDHLNYIFNNWSKTKSAIDSH